MNHINKEHKNLDLNLLRVFNELYQHLNTGEAAKRLGITQPAVSNALKRLRDQLGDPLFIRVGNGLEPTARAHQLGENLAERLQTLLQSCYPPELFDPETYNATVRIALPGYLFETLGSELTLLLLSLLPQAKIHVVHWSASTTEQIESGEIDIAIGHFPMKLSKGIRQLAVVPDPMFLLMRDDHPIASLSGKELSREKVMEHSLCGIFIPEANDYQAVFEEQLKFYKLDFVLRSGSLSNLFDTVLQSDFILPMLRLPASTRPAGIVCTPLDNVAWFTHTNCYVAIYYHQRNSHHPMYQWLESQLKQFIQARAKAAIADMNR